MPRKQAATRLVQSVIVKDQPLWQVPTKDQHAVPSTHCGTQSVKFKDNGRGYASQLHPEGFTQELPSVTPADRCTVRPGDVLRTRKMDYSLKQDRDALRLRVFSNLGMGFWEVHLRLWPHAECCGSVTRPPGKAEKGQNMGRSRSEHLHA
jgi:hypothetical protein